MVNGCGIVVAERERWSIRERIWERERELDKKKK